MCHSWSLSETLSCSRFECYLIKNLVSFSVIRFWLIISCVKKIILYECKGRILLIIYTLNLIINVHRRGVKLTVCVLHQDSFRSSAKRCALSHYTALKRPPCGETSSCSSQLDGDFLSHVCLRRASPHTRLRDVCSDTQTCECVTFKRVLHPSKVISLHAKQRMWKWSRCWRWHLAARCVCVCVCVCVCKHRTAIHVSSTHRQCHLLILSYETSRTNSHVLWRQQTGCRLWRWRWRWRRRPETKAMWELTRGQP